MFLIKAASVFVSLVLCLPIVAVAEEMPEGRSSTERMKLERLEAAQIDAERLTESRTPAESMPIQASDLGLTEFRAIFHAHAEDSDHTGGTRPEMLRDAKKESVDIIFLSDHFRPPRDFMDSWRGIYEGVLFVPGSEMHGFLLHPDESVMDAMDASREELIDAVTDGTGMVFLNHVEERTDADMNGVTGLEIYNRHADAKKDPKFLLSVVMMMLNPDGVEHLVKAINQFPDPVLAAQCSYPEVYLKKWDETAAVQPAVGVGANDCHHNQVFIVKKKDETTALVGTIVDDDEDMREFTTEQVPELAELLEPYAPGDVAVKVDFDPYQRSFRNLSTYVLAEKLTEPSVREAVSQGHMYVCHNWMCPPEGSLYYLERDGEIAGIMGDTLEIVDGGILKAQFPVECTMRLLRNGEEVARQEGKAFEFEPESAGAYRLEAWLDIDGEKRIWLYANPIYLR